MMQRLALVIIVLASARVAQAAGCGFHTPVQPTLTVSGTPRVGDTVDVEVHLRNAYRAGDCTSWLAVTAGAATSATPLTWTEPFALDETVTHHVQLRIQSAEPIALTLKMRPLDPAYRGRPPGEAHLTLYPLDLRAGVQKAHWALPHAIPGAVSATLRDGREVKILTP